MDYINEHQFGFQKVKSTEHAIVDLYSNLIKATENHEKPSCIFVDFVKALLKLMGTYAEQT